MQKKDLATLIESARLLPDVDADGLRRYVERSSESRFEVGWPAADSLLDIWRHRYETLTMHESFDGWSTFFGALESADGTVGLMGLRDGGPAKFILILSESGDKIVAVLSKRNE